jgi:hypothetical protein
VCTPRTRCRIAYFAEDSREASTIRHDLRQIVDRARQPPPDGGGTSVAGMLARLPVKWSFEELSMSSSSLASLASLASLSLLAAAARPADAAPKKLKAEFLCGTYVDGKIRQVLTGGKVGKLVDPIACAIHVADPKEPSHMGNVHTVRYGKTKLVGQGKTDDFGADSEPAKRDFEIVMKPSAPDDNGQVAFQPCEDFDIVATISDDLGVYFTKTIKVQQSCPKPKPIAAKLSCSYEAGDGTLFRWPGSGARQRPRMELRSFDCVLDAASVPDGVALTSSIGIKGKPAKRAPFEQMARGYASTASFHPGDDFDSCSAFVVEASLIDGDGATRFSGKLSIDQDCPD